MHAQRQDKKSIINDRKILTKAIQKLSVQLDLSRQELSNIIGPSEPTFSRMFGSKKTAYLDPSAKEGQLAIYLLQLFISLNILFGGDVKQCQIWLRSENIHLQGKPIDLIKSPVGLVTVMQYLDAMRSKI